MDNHTKSVKLIPEYLKCYFAESEIEPIPSHWRRPQGYEYGVQLFSSRYNQIIKILQGIATYFDINLNEIQSVLNEDEKLVSYLQEKNIIEVEDIVKASSYGTTILFKEKDQGLRFIQRFNQFLKDEYDNLECTLKIKLLLSGENLREYEKQNVFFTSRTLSEHFRGEFGIPYFFRTLEIVEIVGEGSKGMEVKVKFHTDVVGACHICGKPLEDEFSQNTGIGPVCAKRLGVKRTKTEDIEAAKAKIREVAESVGVIGPIYVPKSQIRRIK